MGIGGNEERDQHGYKCHKNAFDFAMQLSGDHCPYDGQRNGKKDSG
jgi:hypothetical protein